MLMPMPVRGAKCTVILYHEELMYPDNYGSICIYIWDYEVKWMLSVMLFILFHEELL